MADDALNTPVIVRAIGLNAASLPAGYSPAYTQYILSQALDFTNVAGKANEAGQGAYDAQVKNDEQDVELADHDARISANTNAITLLEVRVTTAEGKIVVLRSDVDFLLDEVIDIQADIASIRVDYVSKSDSENQVVQSGGGSLIVGNASIPSSDKLQIIGSANVSESYKVSGVQVLGPRQTGWTASTGAADKGAFDASLFVPVSNTYQQGEVAGIRDQLFRATQRIKALEDAMRTHGQIN